MDKPDLSIIMPTRDHANRLPAAIADVLQSPENIELVVVDNGSTDATAGVVKELMKYDSRLKYVYYDLVFAPWAARNAGIQAASSPNCMMHDDDDWIADETVYSQIIKAMKTRDFGMLYGCQVHVDKYRNKLFVPPSYKKGLDDIVIGRDVITFCCQTLVFSKEAFFGSGGIVPLLSADDIAYALNIFAYCKQKGRDIVFLDEHIADYSKHESSMSAANSRNGQRELCRQLIFKKYEMLRK